MTNNTSRCESLQSHSPEAAKFYEELWSSERWSGAAPNYDEELRLSEIIRLIEESVFRGTPLRILDAGCGRGWLTDQLKRFGVCRGIDVIPEAIEIARSILPNVDFGVLDPVQVRAQDILKYGANDLVVASEVIEHIPNPAKRSFLKGLATLIRPDGHLIVTTPRGECWKNWLAKGGKCQPVEEWLTESKLADLAGSVGFRLLARRSIVLPGHEYHWTRWLIRGRFWPRVTSVLGSVRRAVVRRNALYQAVLFQKQANA